MNFIVVELVLELCF